ncbi:hypothetical protein [Humibacillus xanthopallidus]|uniref:hypothetical protein n=1 Tax=Humibacillus xanthopallidus TaxID=412689 RepID=UPI003850B9E3
MRDEIELLLDVIVAIAAYPQHLTAEQVDAVLQLPVHAGDPDLWGSRGLNPGPTDYESHQTRADLSLVVAQGAVPCSDRAS